MLTTIVLITIWVCAGFSFVLRLVFEQSVLRSPVIVMAALGTLGYVAARVLGSSDIACLLLYLYSVVVVGFSIATVWRDQFFHLPLPWDTTEETEQLSTESTRPAGDNIVDLTAERDKRLLP